jgi:hypothetical protein
MVIGSRPTLVPSEAVQLPTTEGQEQVCGFHSFFETASDMLKILLRTTLVMAKGPAQTTTKVWDF